MPEPTASTSRRKLVSRSVLALALAVVVLPHTSTQVIAQTKDIAKAREEAQRLEKPLYKDFEQAVKDFRPKRNVFGRLLLRGAQNRLEEQKINDGIEHRLKLMTNPKLELFELQELRSKLVKDLNEACKLANENQIKKRREKVFRKVTELCAKLLDGNYSVRTQMITILGSLNISTRPTIPYTESRSALLRVARTSEFPEHRLLAMAGLSRMVRYGKLTKPEEMEIVQVISAELRKSGLPSGSYYRLAEWLRHVNHTFEVGGNQSPVAIIALIESMSDENRSWISRAMAARALGSTGDGANSVRWQTITWKVAELAHDAGTEYVKQKAAGGEPRNPVDDAALLDIYLFLAADTEKAKSAGKGALNRSTDATVKAAYDKILPIVKEALGNQTIAEKSLDDLKAWLDANKPADLLYHPNAPPLPMKKQAAGNAGTPPGNQQTGQDKTGETSPGA